MENIRKTLESQAGIYTDITVGEMVAEDGFVMQQLICNQIGADGVAYPCTEIIQVQLMEDREILVSSVSLNTSQATQSDCLHRPVNYMVLPLNKVSYR